MIDFKIALLKLENILKWIIIITFIIMPLEISIMIFAFIQISSLIRNYSLNLKENF